MEKDKINSLITNYAILFSEALMLWSTQTKKSFLTCWKQAVHNSEFTGLYKQDEQKKQKLPRYYEDQLLREGGSQLADFLPHKHFYMQPNQ